MKNSKTFKQFVKDVYEASRERTMEETLWGTKLSFPALYGRIYIANSSPSFSEIEEGEKSEYPIHTFLDSYNISPDMLYLKARKTGVEADIYESQYVSHSITEDRIIVAMRNKTVVFAI